MNEFNGNLSHKIECNLLSRNSETREKSPLLCIPWYVIGLEVGVSRFGDFPSA